jgi:hypothetical protein
MAGLVPAIHVFDPACEKDVDARDSSVFTRVFDALRGGHDESNIAQFGIASRESRGRPRTSSVVKALAEDEGSGLPGAVHRQRSWR